MTMRTHKAVAHGRNNSLRPKAGDTQDYPLYGPGTWTAWQDMTAGAHAQARAIDRIGAQPGALCLIANQSGRVLRVLANHAR